MGDSAICINPNDERYAHLRGKNAIVPIANRVIPIIFDEYVDMEFGTGCLKVTPAHDVNDKELGERHNLEIIDIFNDDATMNDLGLHYKGKDRFVVREEISKELETVQATLAAMESAGSVGTQYNFTPEEVTTGAQIIAAYKQNPVETLQYMLTQAQAAGHNIDGLNAGGSMDMNAVRQMVENAVKPLMTEHQQRQDTQQTNARAQEIYDNFVTRFPDAPLHENSIARLLQSDSSLTPEAAYYKLQAFYAQKGLDWNKSLEVLQQEHNARGNVSERTQVPDGGGNNINVANTDRAVSLNTSTADIIRQAMAEAGIT